MQTIRIIPARHWLHPISGFRASIYGAIPWTTEAERSDWRIVERGYTWEVVDTFGSTTVGLGRKPAATLAEAQATAEAWRAVSPERREIIA